MNPTYAHAKFSNGKEDIVALRNLAPLLSRVQESSVDEESVVADEDCVPETGKDAELPTELPSVEDPGPRRSTRVSKPVDRLIYD